MAPVLLKICRKEYVEMDMKIKKYTAIRQLTNNSFLNLFEMDALTHSGRPFQYYFVSRNPMDKIKLFTKTEQAEGIIIFPIMKETPGILVMIKQYRYPLDDYLYELPAGLIEEGEGPDEAAIREMQEETGLTFEVYKGGNDSMRRAFYMGAGFTDESNQTVFGYVNGTVSKMYQEDSETIQVCLVDKDEAKRILAEEKVSLRCAYLLLHFLHTDSDMPFSFLD